jgi:hypothetical protein
MPQRELDLVPAPDPLEAAILAELGNVDPDSLSPRDALAMLFSLRERLRNGH